MMDGFLAPLAPLVEPAENLNPAEYERYARHLTLPQIGEIGQRRLKNASVLVVGAGGLGAPALLYLAAAGVGTLGVLDHDTVDYSNLQRQIIHADAHVGMHKTASARAALAVNTPLVTVRELPTRLTSYNAAELLSGFDLVLDATDNFATRYLVSDTARELDLPVVWGAAEGMLGQVSVFWARHGLDYRTLFPDAPESGVEQGCSHVGVVGTVCGMIGTAMAAEAIKLITGVGRTLLGRVQFFNFLDASWREVALKPDVVSDKP